MGINNHLQDQIEKDFLEWYTKAPYLNFADIKQIKNNLAQDGYTVYTLMLECNYKNCRDKLYGKPEED